MQPVAPFLKWLPIASSKQNKGSPSTTTITRYARRKAPAGECKAVSSLGRDRRDVGGMSAGYRREIGGVSAGDRREIGGVSADIGGRSAIIKGACCGTCFVVVLTVLTSPILLGQVREPPHIANTHSKPNQGQDVLRGVNIRHC